MQRSAVVRWLPVAVLVSLGTSAVLPVFAQQYTDVPTGAWYAPYVQEATQTGIVSGYKDAYGRLTGEFGPERLVTFGEALKIALESAGYDENLGIGYGHWAVKYLSIAIGSRFEAVQGPMPNLDRPATRAEVASLIADAFRIRVALTGAPTFSDVSFGTQYAGAIEGLARDQVLSGDTDTAGNSLGRFRPSSLINRAETVKIAVLARRYYGQPGGHPVPPSSSSSWPTSTGSCTLRECGIAPAAPNWECRDGSIAGPRCERLSDGRCGWIIRQCPFSSSRSSSSSSSRPTQTYDVQFMKTGFLPSFITVRQGDTVRFRNTSGRLMWVASNPHPWHTDYPDFDQRATVGTGGTFTFRFQNIGVWGYHDEIKPEYEAVIVVNE